MFSKKVIVALDSNDIHRTLELVRILKDEVYAFKIGYEFFFNFGLDGYERIYSISPKIFLDLKLHDIPNTVKNGIAALAKIKPLLTTILKKQLAVIDYEGLNRLLAMNYQY